MKSGDYIGTIVNSYRNIIDGNPGDWQKDLHLVFNRRFTNGYIMNDKPGEVMGRGSSGHEGLYIGDIVNIEGTKVTIEIKNKKIPVILEKGDGIAFKYNGKIKGIYLENIIKQDENEIVIDTTRRVKVGTEVFISYSAKTHESLKQFKNETIKSKIPINVTFNFQKDLTASIKVEYYLDDELINFRHKGIARFEKANNRPITQESIIKQLEKTGGTPFYMEKIKFNDMPDNLFIPISGLNKIRREILDKAQELLLNHYTPTKKSVKATRKRIEEFKNNYEKYENKTNSKAKLSLFANDLCQVRAANGFDLKRIYLDVNCSYNNKKDYYDNIKDILKEAIQIAPEIEIVWVLSSFINEFELIKANDIIKELESEGYMISVMVDSPGAEKIFGCPIYGNHNLNVWNSFTVENLSKYNGLILSSELSGREINEITRKNYIKNTDLEMIIHGNLEVIVSRDDFTNLNDGRDFIISNDVEYATLEDKKRKKFKYKVFFDYNKQSHILNKDCLCLIEEMNDIKKLNLDNLIVDCRYSNEKYTKQILSIYNESLGQISDEKLEEYKFKIMDFSQSYINKGNYIEGRLHEDT